MTNCEASRPNLNLTPEQRALLVELVGCNCALTDEPAVARAYAELRSALDALRHDFASSEELDEMTRLRQGRYPNE